MMKEKARSAYTCEDYRTEMTLVGLQKRLFEADLQEAERIELLKHIRDLEAALDLD